MQVVNTSMLLTCVQARNQGDEATLRNFFAPLEKFFGHISNLLDIV